MSGYGKEYEDELKLIAALKKQYNLSDAKDLAELYSALQSGKIVFHTEAGNQFDDMVYQKYTEMKKNGNKADHTEAVSRKKSKKKQKKIIVLTKKEAAVRRVVMAVLFLTAVLCLGYFTYYCIDAWKVDKESRRLASVKENTTVNDMYKDEIVEVDNGEEIKTYKVLDQYKSLYNSNKTLIGWIKIADTIIDYPVMQTGDNTYYLEHNSNLEEDRNGALFLDTNCDIKNPGSNYIIYGHNMKSGKMFGSLEKYESADYCAGHRYIRFDTIYEEGTYEVMYVFRSHVYKQEEVVFKYYQFYDANSEEEFQSYMNEMEEMSFYDTGVTASYGDMLLTLSTCDYEETNGRFVVVAKRID